MPKAKKGTATNPIVLSRTKVVNMINATKGRFFTVTFIKQNGKERTINCNRRKITPLGYIEVNSVQDKGIRDINPRTVLSVCINGTCYSVKPSAPKKAAKTDSLIAKTVTNVSDTSATTNQS